MIEVNGIAHLKVEIEPMDALEVLLSEYGLDDESIILIDKDSKSNTVGKDALYTCIRTSYHGSPSFEYKLYSDNATLVELFKSLEFVKDIVRHHSGITLRKNRISCK